MAEKRKLVRVSVHLTPEEVRKFKTIAAARGLSLADLIRHEILKGGAIGGNGIRD